MVGEGFVRLMSNDVGGAEVVRWLVKGVRLMSNACGRKMLLFFSQVEVERLHRAERHDDAEPSLIPS